MTELLSDKMVRIGVENHFTVQIPEGSISKVEGGYKFIYFKVLTREKEYRISEPECTTKLKAIKDGAKFVQLEDDIVNINEIKCFSKKFAHKTNLDR